ncbi:hypothetical protein, partial [Scardovia wiggsiae]
ICCIKNLAINVTKKVDHNNPSIPSISRMYAIKIPPPPGQLRPKYLKPAKLKTEILKILRNGKKL